MKKDSTWLVEHMKLARKQDRIVLLVPMGHAVTDHCPNMSMAMTLTKEALVSIHEMQGPGWFCQTVVMDTFLPGEQLAAVPGYSVDIYYSDRTPRTFLSPTEESVFVFCEKKLTAHDKLYKDYPTGEELRTLMAQYGKEIVFKCIISNQHYSGKLSKSMAAIVDNMAFMKENMLDKPWASLLRDEMGVPAWGRAVLNGIFEEETAESTPLTGEYALNRLLLAEPAPWLLKTGCGCRANPGYGGSLFEDEDTTAQLDGIRYDVKEKTFFAYLSDPATDTYRVAPLFSLQELSTLFSMFV